jgi:hypothetical protein
MFFKKRNIYPLLCWSGENQNYEPLEKGLKFRISTLSVGAPARGCELLLKCAQSLFYKIELKDTAVRASLSGSTVTVIGQERF